MRGLTDQEIEEMERKVEGKSPVQGGLTDAEINALERQEFEAARKALQGPSKLESFSRGFVQGPTFGYAPHIQSQVMKTPLDQERYKYANAQETNPYSYGTGNWLGSIAAQAIPGLGIGRNTSLGMGALKALAQGGIEGSSRSNSMQDLPMDVGLGSALNLGGHTLGLGAGYALNALTPNSLKKLAQERAVKAAIGGGNEPGWRRVAGITPGNPGTIERADKNIAKTGRDLLDEPNLITAFSSTKDLAPKLSKAKEKYGHQLGDIENNIDLFNPKGVVNSKKVADDLLSYASKLPEHAEGRAIQDRLLNEGIDFSKKPMRGFGESKEWKNSRKYVPNSPDLVISNQKAANAVRKSIGNSMEDAARHQGVLDKYKNAKSKYSSFVKTAGGATTQGIKKLNNRLPSLTDYMVGTGVGSAAYGSGGNPAYSAMAGLMATFANKLARERGSSTAAVLADQMSNVLDKSPKFAKAFGSFLIDAAQRGGTALATTHYLLMKNPEYRQEFEQSAEEGLK